MRGVHIRSSDVVPPMDWNCSDSWLIGKMQEIGNAVGHPEEFTHITLTTPEGVASVQDFGLGRLVSAVHCDTSFDWDDNRRRLGTPPPTEASLVLIQMYGAEPTLERVVSDPELMIGEWLTHLAGYAEEITTREPR